MERKKEEKNVLLLCLSPYGYKGFENKAAYYRWSEPECKKKVCGRMTDEAPAKSVLYDLHKEGRRLDKIVMICSEKVKKNIAFKSWNSDQKDKTEIDYKKILREEYGIENAEAGITHVQLFQACIKKYVEEIDLECLPEFEYINIQDVSEQQEIAKACIDAADKVLGMDPHCSNIHLYIDFNGGQRYVPFMLNNISGLMSLRGVKIERTMTMNYDNKRIDEEGESYVDIRDMEPIFNLGKLVSGIHEYKAYGRVKGLKLYYQNCIKNKSKYPKLVRVLRKMEEFSMDLQLCRTDSVIRELGLDLDGKHRNIGKNTLKYSLDNYQRDNDDTYSQLFEFVVKDIKSDYRKMFEGDFLDVIQWCLDKDFVQQALTFYAERMPVYLWSKGILRPTEQEEIGYLVFLNEGEKKKTREYNSYFRNYNEKYAWFNSYITYRNEMLKKIFQFETLNNTRKMTVSQQDLTPKYSNNNILAKKLKDRKILNITWGEFIEFKNEKKVYYQSSWYKNNAENIKNKMIKQNVDNEESLEKNFKRANYLMINMLYADKKPRSESNVDFSKLFEVIMIYYMVKDIRNNTNHGDGNRDPRALLRLGVKTLRRRNKNAKKIKNQ